MKRGLVVVLGLLAIVVLANSLLAEPPLPDRAEARILFEELTEFGHDAGGAQTVELSEFVGMVQTDTGQVILIGHGLDASGGSSAVFMVLDIFEGLWLPDVTIQQPWEPQEGGAAAAIWVGDDRYFAYFGATAGQVPIEGLTGELEMIAVPKDGFGAYLAADIRDLADEGG